MSGAIPKRRQTTHIIVHCSATEQGSVASFRRFHVEEKGWSDIGYHFVIGNGHGMTDGAVEAGRGEDLTGAHCVGYNQKSIGVCLVGDLDKQGPTQAQNVALVKLLAKLCKKYNLPYTRILGHRETPSGKQEGKSCPGVKVDMKAIRVAVMKELARG